MSKSSWITVAVGAVLTLAAFVAGHFIYTSGNQRVGYLIGVMAMAPLGIATFIVWNKSGTAWAKILFWTVALLWGAMLLFSMM